MFYKIPHDILDGQLNQYELLPYLFALRYKDYYKKSVFTISTLLKYFGTDEHHRKVSSMKESIISLSEKQLVNIENVSDFDSIDKHTMIICEANNHWDKFVSLHYFELDKIVQQMSKTSNYNLLNIFCSIKSDATVIGKNLDVNKFSSTEIGYRKITSMSGISNGRTIKDAIDLLVDCEVMKMSQTYSNKRTKNIYSFYENTIAKLNRV